MSALNRSLIMLLSLFALICAGFTGCAAIDTMDSSTSSPKPDDSQAEAASANACPVTEPLWVKPPDDSAVQGSPGYGYYYVNEDRSIWASAWWTGEGEYRLRVSEEGIKVGWFRPAGATLEITGRRIDAQAPPLDAHIPGGYPTRFQATGLVFHTDGCWEVAARAAESELSFVVWVEP
jgi:hypothetical protein